MLKVKTFGRDFNMRKIHLSKFEDKPSVMKTSLMFIEDGLIICLKNIVDKLEYFSTPKDLH